MVMILTMTMATRVLTVKLVMTILTKLVMVMILTMKMATMVLRVKLVMIILTW